MMEAYQFWAYSVNKAGGIPVGAGASQRHLQVDFRVLMDNMNATLHSENMIEAVKSGNADFLLGGSTHLAASDWNASVESQRITMLCCHGPPLIYEQAMSATQNSTLEDYLFGIQINSEQYPITLIREIALNQKAKLIALPVLNSQNPDQNLFTNTTCQSAINELISINSSGLYDAPPAYEVFLFDISQSGNLTYFREMARTIKNKTVNGVNFDMVIACTLDSDGRTLAEALQIEEVPLKGVFSTVMPTSPSSVDYVAQCKNVTMADVLSASQWHPELPFIDQTPNVMWPSATAFAQAFQSWSPSHAAATYTHAGAAAAAFAIQVAITDAFAKCDLSSWNGDVAQLLYGTKWPCAGVGNPPTTGYSLVLNALRRIHRDSFWGTIQFDSNQRNNGRDTVTVQLLPLSNRVGGNTFQSINFGCDANGNTTLIQEAVLPSQYETKAIVLPRPPRSYDRPCPDGQGLDANNDCQLCQPGTARGGLASTGSSKWYCNACNLTSYADSSGMPYCQLCPPGTRTNILGATAISDCACVGGYFNQTGQTGVPCSACPPGATCPGGIDPPQPLPGYWTNSSLEQYVASVFSCNPPEACVNNFQTGQVCAEGWGGPLCSLCGFNNAANPSNAYHLVFGSCMRCGTTATNVLSFLGILALWVFLKMFLLAKWRTAGFLVGWMQMMSVMSSVNAKWPTSLENFFNVAAFFAFGVNIVGFQCLDPSWNFLNDMVLQFLLPVFFILLILGYAGVVYLWTYFRLLKRKSDENESAKSSIDFAEVWGEMKKAGWSWNSIAGRMLGILDITFVPSTQMAMSGLRFKYVSGARVVAKAPYTAQSTAIIVLSTLGLCIYSIAYPVYVFVHLWSCSPDSAWRRGTNSNRPRHEDPGGFREKENLQLLGWMYDLLRVERFYMALMHLYHRFVYIALMVLITNPAVQLVLSLLWTFLFAAVFAVAPPYFHKRFNILVGLLYLTVVIVLGCGSSFYSPYSVFEGSGWVSGFEILAFIAIGVGAFVFIWVGIVELLEMMSSMVACEVLYQHLPYSAIKCKESDIDELADVFNQARLWR